VEVVPAPPPPAAAEAPATWVDGSALEGGDGSELRPFKTLQAALAAAPAPRRVALRAGLYRGPFTLPDRLRVEGPETAVLYVDGADGAVVSPAGSAELEGLSIQGGEVGLRVARGRVTGRALHFSGQRRAAVQVEGGQIELSGSELKATVSETVGVGVGRGRAQVTGSRFEGPFRRAVAMPWPMARDAAADGTADGALEVAGCRFDQAVTAVHAVGGRVRLDDLSASGGRGPAVFLASGQAEVRSLRVDGHEYALQARGMQSLDVKDLTAVRPERSGVAVVNGRATLEDLTVVSSGDFGAVAAIGAEVVVKRFRLHRPGAYGITARDATLTVVDGEISEVLPDRDGGAGDALHLRDARAVVERVSVRQAAGVGLLAAQASRVEARSLILQGCRWGGLVVETLADLEGTSVVVQDSGGAALAVPGDASARVDLLVSERNAEGALWADCASGAKVHLTRVREDGPPGRSLPCVREPGR
jgi:hypothetical protein